MDETAVGPLMVMTTLPDHEAARALALTLIERRLAACVNLLPAAQSIYRWQGKVEEAVEIPLIIKTVSSRYAALQTAIEELHPYDVPELIALPITQGLPAYLAWLNEQTQNE